MREGPASPEATPLTPMQRVMKENLYANLRFPQDNAAILLFTLNAIVSADNPQELVGSYLTSELSDEDARMFLEHATRAHVAYLPEETIPDLTVERMQQLWQSERESIKMLLSAVNGVQPIRKDGARSFSPEMLSMVKELSATGVKSFKTEQVASLLQKYRDTFKKGNDASSLVARGVAQEIRRIVIEDMLQTARAHPEYGERPLRVFFEALGYDLKPRPK